MKTSSFSTLTAVLVLSFIGFVSLPTSTKYRVLKSVETLFDIKEGSLKQAYQSIKFNSSSGTSDDNTTNSKEAQEYFEEICLKDEFGNKYSEVFKTEHDVKIFVEGSTPDYMITELQDIVNDLNELIDPIELEIVSNKSEANTFIYLGSAQGFHTLNPKITHNLTNKWGYFETRTNIKTNVTKAYIFVDMVNTGDKTVAQRSVLREELTQSLGFTNDSEKYPNSIFYQHGNTVTEFSDLDKEIIRMLYNN